MSSRARLSGSRPEQALDDALAVSAELISKTYSAVHETRYRPAVSVFARWRERRSDVGGDADPELGDIDDDDDDAEEFLQVREAGAALADVSFEVRRGEAVGVTGSPEASRTVARILCGMMSPTSGRIVVRGRVAPSIELATFLAQRETTARGVARRLAALAGPEWRQRRQFVLAALELALGDSQAEADAARPSKNVLRRVAAAAAFDPTADVLVIDALPDHGDPDFPRRCRERLAERLLEGAGVVITAPDPGLIADFCARVVWLDEGRVARIVSMEEVSAATERASAESAGPPSSGAEPSEAEPSETEPGKPEPRDPPSERIRTKPELRSSDEHAALRSFALLRLDGSPLEDARSDDWIVARIGFEITTPATVKLVVRLVGGETPTFVERGELGEGTYVATLRIPPGAVPAGEYDIAVGLILEREGERTKVGQRDAARLQVDGDDEGLVAAAEVGAAPATAAEAGALEAEWSFEAVLD